MAAMESLSFRKSCRLAAILIGFASVPGLLFADSVLAQNDLSQFPEKVVGLYGVAVGSDATTAGRTLTAKGFRKLGGCTFLKKSRPSFIQIDFITTQVGKGCGGAIKVVRYDLANVAIGASASTVLTSVSNHFGAEPMNCRRMEETLFWCTWTAIPKFKSLSRAEISFVKNARTLKINLFGRQQ